MSSPEPPPERGSTWFRDVRRSLGNRAQGVWRATRGRDPKPGIIKHLGDPTPRVELPASSNFSLSHDVFAKLKERGVELGPEPPAQDRGQEPGFESESESVEQIDDWYHTRRINPEDFGLPTIEDPEFSDFSFSDDVFAELRERGIEPEPFGAYREHFNHLEPGPTPQERLDHYLERGIEEPEPERPVTMQQQLDKLNDRPGVVARSVGSAGWRLQQLHDELNGRTGRHQADFGVGPDVPAQPPAADIPRSDDNRRVRFAETKKVRTYDQDPSREPLTPYDYLSFDSNSPDDDAQSFDSNASTDTIYPYDDPRETTEDDQSFDSSSSDGDSANAPGGIQVHVDRLIEVTSRPSSHASIYRHGSNSSFGGYSNDARVGPLQRQLAADREQVADNRARDTMPDYGQNL
jgi:hypothetical protein